jgi:hypothetical protein
VWNPVRIVAGGYISGLVAHPAAPGLIYARTDIGSVYRFNAHDGQWIPRTDYRTPTKQDGAPTLIQADPRVYGKVYLGMNGRGIIYREPPRGSARSLIKR